MSKKKKTEQSGEQLDLIDVQSKNVKPIMLAARLYKGHQAARLAALATEIKQKQKVLELVKAAKLQPLEGGVIRFECDDMLITIKPRDELVQVKEKTESE